METREKSTRNKVRGIIIIIPKQDKRSTIISSGLLLIKQITLSIQKKWNESPQCYGQKIGMFHESVSVQLFVKHVWFKTEYVIVSAVLL